MRDGSLPGFSTLETLVAIAVLAICLAPLLTYQAQLASAAERLRRQTEQHAALRVASGYLMELTASDLPEGRLDIGGGWTLSWTVQDAAGPATGRIGTGLETRYQGELVALDAVLTDSLGHSKIVPVRRLIIQETGPALAE